MNVKPLSEVLAGLFANALHEYDSSHPRWENTSDERQRAFLFGMHSITDSINAFGIQIVNSGGEFFAMLEARPEPTPEIIEWATEAIRKHNAGTLIAQVNSRIDPIANRSLAVQSGFTGDSCNSCGSMQMTRNGSCLKCMACGETSGCS